jgi:hypothetical protein
MPTTKRTTIFVKRIEQFIRQGFIALLRKQSHRLFFERFPIQLSFIWHASGSLLPFDYFKMASQLNSYRNFIDIKTKEGQALVSNAIYKYVSPLMGDDHISLSSTSFQKLKDNLLRLSSRFG